MVAAMAGEDSSAKRPISGFARRWAATGSTAGRSYRTTFRLLAVPILVVAGVLVYRGLQDRFVLPECDSPRAKDTLADVFKQLKIAPLRFEPIKTISTSKAEVVCNAARRRRQCEHRLPVLLAGQYGEHEIFDFTA